jgi:hypothetical protein
LLNPVRAEMTKTAGQYLWSSYRAMIGKTTTPDWLDKDWVLGHYGKRLSTAQKNFISFVREGKKQSPIWEQLRQQLYLGDEQFVSKLQSRQALDKDLSEVSKIQRHRVSKSLSYYAKKHNHRNNAIYAAYRNGTYTQKEISDYFKIHYSTASKIIKKLEKEKLT